MLQNHIYSLKPVSVILENLGNMNNDTQALQHIKETPQNSSAHEPETANGERKFIIIQMMTIYYVKRK